VYNFYGGGGSLAGRYIQLLCAGWGWLAGRYKRRRAGQPGRYKIFLMGGGASLPAQELTHWSLYNIITHKRLSPCQTFSGSLDADSIYMALNKTCPRFHFHTGNNETPITLSGITVYPYNIYDPITWYFCAWNLAANVFTMAASVMGPGICMRSSRSSAFPPFCWGVSPQTGFEPAAAILKGGRAGELSGWSTLPQLKNVYKEN
jgi:hypothetical protein